MLLMDLIHNYGDVEDNHDDGDDVDGMNWSTILMMLMMPGSGLGALVDVDKLGQTRRSVSLPPLDDVRVGVEGSSCPHKAATLEKNT